MSSPTTIQSHIAGYVERLSQALRMEAMVEIEILGQALRSAWVSGHTIYLCGNGGSAGNAIYLANDFLYGAGVSAGAGLRVEALSANPAVLTCLANDVGYESVYAEQLRVKAVASDVLIVLSGSGNSANVINALEVGNARGMKTFAILGYDGGGCKQVAQHAIYFAIDDMQIAEDLQLIVGHICMQWLYANPIERAASGQ